MVTVINNNMYLQSHLNRLRVLQACFYQQANSSRSLTALSSTKKYARSFKIITSKVKIADTAKIKESLSIIGNCHNLIRMVRHH